MRFQSHLFSTLAIISLVAAGYLPTLFDGPPRDSRGSQHLEDTLSRAAATVTTPSHPCRRDIQPLSFLHSTQHIFYPSLGPHSLRTDMQLQNRMLLPAVESTYNETGRISYLHGKAFSLPVYQTWDEMLDDDERSLHEERLMETVRGLVKWVRGWQGQWDDNLRRWNDGYDADSAGKGEELIVRNGEFIKRRLWARKEIWENRVRKLAWFGQCPEREDARWILSCEGCGSGVGVD